MLKLKECSTLTKICFSLCAVLIGLTPIVIVYINDWAKFELNFLSITVSILFLISLAAITAAIFGYDVKFSTLEQDKKFSKKFTLVYNRIMPVIWITALVWGLKIAYDIWSKKSGI